MKWLDRYHDDWRTADYPLDLGVDESGSYVDLIQNGFTEQSPLITTGKLVSTSKAGKVSTRATSSF